MFLHSHRRCSAIGLLVAMLALGAFAEGVPRDPVPLWEGNAPGAQGNTARDRPTLQAFPVMEAESRGTAVIVTPGGGYRALKRHERGDWGDLCAEDMETNERALQNGGRLFSRYHDGMSVKFYVITEADRSATTVLLPEDY